MKYAIINRQNGSAMEMHFQSESELENWLEINPTYDNLGIIDYSLPTRHVRMQNKDESSVSAYGHLKRKIHQ